MEMPMTMPMHMKTAALILTIMGIMLAIELANLTHTLTQPKQNTYLNFSSTLGYFYPLTHRLSSLGLLSTGQKLSSHLIDLSWYKKMGPEGLANLQLMASKTITTFHTGLIKTYLGSFALSILIMLMTH